MTTIGNWNSHFEYLCRLSGLQDTKTLSKLTSGSIIELELSMRSFPTFLAKHAEDNNIQLTETEVHRIYKLFQDSTMTDSVNNFREYAFRNGDKSLLLNLGRLATKKTEQDNTNMDYCNPNAVIATVYTTVGSFYGGDESTALDGMYELIIQ